MPDERDVKFQEILKELLEQSAASGAHRKLAEAIGVTPQTVSHYVTGRAKPSFDALIGIRTHFNVTLDHLVFGERARAAAAAADQQSLRADVRRALSEATDRAGRQRDMVARVGRALLGEVERVAQGLLENRENFGPAGFFTDQEAMAIESCAERTRIMIRSAPADIAVDERGAAGPGDYFPTLVDNLGAGRRYQFVFYGAPSTYAPYAKAYRRLLGGAGLDPDALSRNLGFRVLDAELPAAVVIHDLDLSRLQRREPLLWERFREDGIVDGAFAYTAVRHQDALGGVVLYSPYLESAVRMFERDWQRADTL